MGRGSSGANQSAGGGASAGGGYNALPNVTNQVTPPTPQQVASGNVLPGGGVAFDEFMDMTDDEKADVVTKALQTGVPLFLDDSGLQRFAYFTGMSDKPNIVSDSQLDSMSGHELFRTVNDAYDPSKDIGYTSKDIAKQIMSGDFTMYSDSGGSAYGKAIYFASSVRSSSYYAGNNASMIRAKVTGGKSISDASANRQYNNALSRGDKLAVACSRAGSSSASNLYALTQGYDIIASSDYHMVLNRKCLSISSKIKTGVSYGDRTW